MIVVKKIKDLAVGHYIVEIVEQSGGFVLKKPSHIQSQQTLDVLVSRGVKSVRIDTSKTIKISTTTVAKTRTNSPLKTANANASAPKSAAKPRKKNEINTKLAEDIGRAQQIFSESKKLQKKIFADAMNGREIDLAPVQKVTTQAMNAIFKNPDALACVLNVRIKDEYLLEHSVSVSILLTIFARYLKIDKAIIHELAVGAFLHDVGKIMIPDKVLNKPGKLTDQEYEIIKSHASHSISIIKKTPGISELSLEVAAQHHEKLDGKGYPNKLKDSEITQYGRMISICDIFDALTADRCYKEGYTQIKAFNILRHLAEEGALDKPLVDQFIRCIGVYPVGTLVALDSKRLAIVEARNPNDPIRPSVRAFYNVNELNYTAAENVNLADSEDFIVKGVRANDFNLDMNKIVEFLMRQG